MATIDACCIDCVVFLDNLVRRLGGSHDLFSGKRSPSHSINFITCHDGFTLRSYERKHNQRNGGNNRDGTDANWILLKWV